jgi:predicted outer membrane protein
MTVPASLAALAAVLVAAAPGANAPAPGDAEAIAFAITVDSGELMMADLAISKKVSSGVMEYVTDLKEDHKEHLADIMSVATKGNTTPMKSPAIDSLKKKTMDAHHKLMSMNGTDFEKAFLDEMITGHTEVLEKLEKKILTMELSAPVKDEMEDLRKGVQEHLGKAKALRIG